MATDAIRDPKCPLCDGTGWKTGSVQGRVRTVAPCDCRLARRRSRLIDQAGIPRQYAHCTFDNFYLTFPGATDHIAKAFIHAKKFADDYFFGGSSSKGILLWGECGTGKTHLATAILRHLILQGGCQGVFRGYTALLKQIRQSYGREIVIGDTREVLTEYAILDDVIQAEVLLLDDLGGENASGWATELLYHVINERYCARRTTIITTNFLWAAPPMPAPEDQGEWQDQQAKRDRTLSSRFPERTCSRIAEMCSFRVEFQGADYRRLLGLR